MHFIDKLPWHVYVIVLILSIIGITYYFILNKKYNILMKIGSIVMIIGAFQLLMDKLIMETSFKIKYNNLIKLPPVATIIGFLIFYGGIVKNTDDPVKKRKLKNYYIFLCVAFGFVGVLMLYVLMVID